MLKKFTNILFGSRRIMKVEMKHMNFSLKRRHVKKLIKYGINPHKLICTLLDGYFKELDKQQNRRKGA